jgi:hypothetical protein
MTDSDELDPYFLSVTSTSMKQMKELVPVPEFPNLIPVILSSVGMLAVVLFIKKKVITPFSLRERG